MRARLRRRTVATSIDHRARHTGGPRGKESLVALYGIVRRNGWRTPDDLQAAAARSTEEGDKEGSGVRWIRSYVLAEESGELGTFCVYEADSPEAIRTHANAA